MEKLKILNKQKLSQQPNTPVVEMTERCRARCY